MSGEKSLPELMVTRGDGVPLPDQKAAVEEFKRQAGVGMSEWKAVGAAVAHNSDVIFRCTDKAGKKPRPDCARLVAERFNKCAELETLLSAEREANKRLEAKVERLEKALLSGYEDSFNNWVIPSEFVFTVLPQSALEGEQDGD